MYKKKVRSVACSVCTAPGASSVSCNYCKEQSKDKSIKPTHTLCNRCFMRGCPTVYMKEGMVVPKSNPLGPGFYAPEDIFFLNEYLIEDWDW